MGFASSVSPTLKTRKSRKTTTKKPTTTTSTTTTRVSTTTTTKLKEKHYSTSLNNQISTISNEYNQLTSSMFLSPVTNEPIKIKTEPITKMHLTTSGQNASTSSAEQQTEILLTKLYYNSIINSTTSQETNIDDDDTLTKFIETKFIFKNFSSFIPTTTISIRSNIEKSTSFNDTTSSIEVNSTFDITNKENLVFEKNKLNQTSLGSIYDPFRQAITTITTSTTTTAIATSTTSNPSIDYYIITSMIN